MSDKIKVTGAMDLGQAATLLDDVVKALRDGEFYLDAGERTLVLKPADTVEFEMKLAEKKGKGTFKLEIEWKTPPDATTAAETALASGKA